MAIHSLLNSCLYIHNFNKHFVEPSKMKMA